MHQSTRNSFIICLVFFLMDGFIVLSSLLAETPEVEEILTRVWEKEQAQRAKVNDYVCTINTNRQEKDSTGKTESITQIEIKSYFKKPDKQIREFVRASKDGKPASKKDLQPGVFATPFLRSSEELSQQIKKELESIPSPPFRDKLDFKLLRQEKIGGNNTWVIEATSRSKELKIKKATLWINQDKLRRVKLEAESIENPSTFVKIIRISTYQSEVAPGIFLPKTMKIETSLAETVNEYSHYQINCGLEDSLFQKK